jgi:2-oxoglutarate dehydrogenase E2 component (dihydrolipoamide succinyltransferase)
LAAERAVLRSTLHRRCRAGDLGAAAARRDPPVSRLALVLFELAQALRVHRRLNATLRDTAIGLYREINLGFAVDMGRGLKVLVVPQADRLTLEQVHDVTEDLLVKYATDTLAVADVTGSTFTVTDLSAEGVEAFAPLLNREQAAILGLGTDGEEAGALTLSCAFDHRILGGREVAVFLRELATRLEAQAPRKGVERRTEEEPLCAWCLRGPVDLRPLRAALIPSVEPAGYVCSICFNGLG